MKTLGIIISVIILMSFCILAVMSNEVLMIKPDANQILGYTMMFLSFFGISLIGFVLFVLFFKWYMGNLIK